MFAVIRDVIGAMNKVALGRVVLTSREHVIAIEPRQGLMGTLLRYATRCASLRSTLSISPRPRSRRICSTWRSTSSKQNPAISIPRSSRTTTRTPSRSYWPTSKRAKKSRAPDWNLSPFPAFGLHLIALGAAGAAMRLRRLAGDYRHALG